MSDKKYMDSSYLKAQVNYWRRRENECRMKWKAYQAELDRRDEPNGRSPAMAALPALKAFARLT